MATSPTTPNSGGELPFARTLFDACDGLRGHVESSEYKHLVLGLIFLKYISDAFESPPAKRAQEAVAVPADPEAYTVAPDC